MAHLREPPLHATITIQSISKPANKNHRSTKVLINNNLITVGLADPVWRKKIQFPSYTFPLMSSDWGLGKKQCAFRGFLHLYITSVWLWTGNLIVFLAHRSVNTDNGKFYLLLMAWCGWELLYLP